MRPGCAWQLATSPATNVFPKHPLLWPYQQIKKNLPTNLWWSVPLTFFECVNNFWLAGQTPRPGDVCCVSLPPRACPCVCGGDCVCACLCRFEYIYVLCAAFPSLPAWSRGKKAMSFFHNLIRGYTQERAAAAWTSLIMLMRSPGYVVIEV